MSKKIIMKEENQKKRQIVNNWNIDDKIKENQRDLLRKIFMNYDCKGEEYISFKNAEIIVKKEIKKKLSSYKQQDRSKKKLNENKIITADEILEKLVGSKLKCYYCKEDIRILYEEVRDDKQWTLDRIDNSIGHNEDNVVICCLKCNLQRRVRDDEKFKFTKQLKLKKIN